MSVKSHERHSRKKSHTWGECGFKFPHFHAKLEQIPLLITLKEVYFLGADDELLPDKNDDRSLSDLIPLTPVDSLKSAKKIKDVEKKREGMAPGDPLLKAFLSKSKKKTNNEKIPEERLEKIMDKVHTIEKELKSLKKSFVKYGPVYETRFASVNQDSSGTRFTLPMKYAGKPLKPVEEILYGRAGTNQDQGKIFDRILTHPKAMEFSRDSESLLMSMMSENVYEKIKTEENQNLIKDEWSRFESQAPKKVREKKVDTESAKEHPKKKDSDKTKETDRKKHSDKETKHDKKKEPDKIKEPDKKKYSDKIKEQDKKKDQEKNREKDKKKESDKKVKTKEEEGGVERKRSRHKEGSPGSSNKKHRYSPHGKLREDSYNSHVKVKSRHKEDLNSKKKPYESSCSKFMDESYALFLKNKTRLKECDVDSRRRWLEILECLYTPRSAYRPSTSSLQSISDPYMPKPKIYNKEDGGVGRRPDRVKPVLRMPSSDRWPTKWATRETDYTF